MVSKWVKLSPEEAKRNALYGVKGWLVVFAVGALLGLLREYGSLSGEAHKAGMSIGDMLAIDHPAMTYAKITLVLNSSVVVIIYWLLFSKHPNFRPFATWVLVSGWPVAAVIGLANPFPGLSDGLAVSFLSWVISCAVWVAYLQRSRRVRVTYEHCIRANDDYSTSRPTGQSQFATSTSTSTSSSAMLDRTAAVEPGSFGAAPIDSRSTPSPQTLVDEDYVYAVIARELEDGTADKGLWTRLFSECGGDEQQTKVHYIKRRAAKMISAERAHLEQAARERVAEAERLEQFRLKGAKESEFLTAAQTGDWDTASRLLRDGVEPAGLRDERGRSPYDLAFQRGDQQMIKLIQSHWNSKIRLEQGLLAAAKYLAQPIPADIYCQKYQVPRDRLDHWLGKGELKAYVSRNETFVEDRKPDDHLH